jgi:hypothetical protein
MHPARDGSPTYRTAGLRAVIKGSLRRWLPSTVLLSPDAPPPDLYVSSVIAQSSC